MPASSPLKRMIAQCLLATVACSDDASTSLADTSGASGQAGQAGASGSAGSAGSSVEPTPPAPPVLTPCPERWTEKTLPSGVVACEPGPLPDWACPAGWLPKAMLQGTPRQYNICEPPPLPESCPEGTMAVLGESACQPIGDPCPAGDFPDNLPADKPVLFVKAGASGGDGSQGKPFAMIGEAVKAAKAATVVAIAKGVYSEAVAVGAGKDVTLWGACATGVTIQGPEGDILSATISAQGSLATKATLRTRNLTIRGERPGLKFYRAAGGAEGVVLSSNRTFGIFVEGATIDLKNMLVEKTQGSSDGSFGHGFDCKGGSKVQMSRVTFDQNRDAGILLFDKSTSVTLSDVIVRRTLSEKISKKGGRGLDIEGGAELSAERVLLEQNRDFAAFAFNNGSKLSMKDAILRQTQSRESDVSRGYGLVSQQGAEVSLERVVVDGNRETNVLAALPGAKLTVRDAVIQNAQSSENNLSKGRGLQCQDKAEVLLERVLFDRNREAGIYVTSGAHLELREAIIQETQSRESDLMSGLGLQCREGSEAVLDRVFFHRNRYISAAFLGAGTKVQGTDIVIEETLSQESDQIDGRGLQCQGGAQCNIKRALLDRSRNLGVVSALKGTNLSLQDVIVQNTLSDASDDEYGIGVAVGLQANLSMERALLDTNRVAALLLLQSSTATLSSCWLRNTLQGDFTPLDDADVPLPAPVKGVGDGLIVLSGSSVTATDLLSSGHQRAGLLFVDSGGTLTTTTSTGNQYGLVLRGSSQPSRDETCSFDGNETPILPDGDLPVPNAPLQTPPPLD